MYYVCHNTHILVKGKMKKDEKNEEKKRMNPWFYAIFWLSRQKLARSCDKRTIHQNPAPYRLAYKRSRATALKRTAPSSMTCENKEGGPATGPALLLQIVI